MDLLNQTTLLAVLGAVGLAWEGSKPANKNPLLLLAGGMLLVFVTMQHLFYDESVFLALPNALKDLGLGFLAGAAVFMWRKAAAQSFLLGGLSLLGLAGLGYGAWFLFQNQGQAASKTTAARPLLVELGEDDRIEELQARLNRYGLVAERAFPNVSLAEDANLAQYYIVSGKEVEAFRKEVLQEEQENVDSAEYDEAVQLSPLFPATKQVQSGIQTNDPRAGEQWALKAIYAPEALVHLQALSPKKKAVVAILDTGVEGKHEDLSTIFGNSPASRDPHGHGTHCAGIAGANTNNGIGIASLNWDGKFVEVRGYAALGPSGSGSNETIAQSMVDASLGGADVLSLSLGGYSPRPAKVLRDAVAFALKRNIAVVVAAGNSNDDARNHSPANVEGVITVAAVDQAKRKASFSNTNQNLKRPIAAPGVDILSSKPNSTYESHSGTSMATPMVAGLVGVLRALNPDLSPEALYQVLVRTGQEGSDTARVGRIINAEAAIRAVK